jgi:ribosomal protein S12 methylthiotransferase
MKRIGFIGLGCEKNTVNTEKMMAAVADAGYTLVGDMEDCAAVIINTCGFIESAKQEAIETIFEVVRLKGEGKVGKIIVCGCLAERYQKDIAEELPEVDGFLGVGSFQRVAEALALVLAGERVAWFDDKELLQLEGKRIRTSPTHTAYIKIADGCNNRCAYCCIPDIRGRFHSRPIEKILQEAKEAIAEGCKELILIAQDTTNYGIDLYGERCLPKLIREILKLEGLQWLRLLYLYPDKVDGELIDLFAEENALLPYIEMPIQHGVGSVLNRMNRPGDEESLLALIQTLRARIPNLTLRTTLIVGFPGETEEEFDALCRFVRKAEFDKLGVFPYFREEDTPAYDFPDQVEEEIKQKRLEVVETIQADIVEQKQAALLGKKLTVLAEGFDQYAECFYGRSVMEAPDIDGKIFFTAAEKPQIGEFITVEIQDVMDFDLIGERIEE